MCIEKESAKCLGNRKICKWGSSVTDSVFVIFQIYLFFTVQLEILFGYRQLSRELKISVLTPVWGGSSLKTFSPRVMVFFYSLRLYCSLLREKTLFLMNNSWSQIYGLTVPSSSNSGSSLWISPTPIEREVFLYFLWLRNSFLSLIIQRPVGNRRKKTHNDLNRDRKLLDTTEHPFMIKFLSKKVSKSTW